MLSTYNCQGARTRLVHYIMTGRSGDYKIATSETAVQMSRNGYGATTDRWNITLETGNNEWTGGE